MLSKQTSKSQLGFYSTFEEQLSHRHPLYILANKINWNIFEEAFAKHYSHEGRPAKPIRLMVSLLILKHIRNISDESVVEQWFENIYYQYFSGEKSYACAVPCEASELVHFRNRIGTEGIELIFKESIRISDRDSNEQDATTDTAVQEKNITYPTDNKLHRKMIKRCIAIADTEGIELRQRYTRPVKKLLLVQRFRNHPKNKGKARKADRKVKTITGRLVRELDRKLAPGLHQDVLTLFKKVLAQNKADSNKIYSLHEPGVQCMSKGKEHKKYEFGSKVSIIEPGIGHLKQDHRLSRNFYKGIKGDNNNIMLAAAALNFKRMMNIYKKMLLGFFMRILCIIQNLLLPEKYFTLSIKMSF